MKNYCHWLGAFILGLVFCFSSYSQTSSDTFVKNSRPKKPAVQVGSLRIGSYNFLNLFEKNGHIHETFERLVTLFPEARRPLEKALKSLKNLKAQAKNIEENNYDVLAVEEVENLTALAAFSEEFLAGAYDSYLIEGNDPRGIDVGFLVKSELPFEVEQRTHQEETWNDTTQGGKKSKVFSRDFPSLIFRTSKKSAPLMVVFGTHFKSKRDRPHDPLSKILRKAQVDKASEIVKDYEGEFGKHTPIFVAGDFNGVISKEKEFDSLKEVAHLTDAFDVVSPPLSDEDRITHSYFPKEGRPKWAQLDAVLANKPAAELIKEAKVTRYTDHKGEEIPVPQSFEELRKTQPSDHYPVQVEMDFSLAN